MNKGSALLSIAAIALGGCLMNWSALEPDGSAATGMAGAGGGTSGAAGAPVGGKAGSSGAAGAGAGGAKAGAAGVGGSGSTGKGGASGAGAAGAGGAGSGAGGVAGAGAGGKAGAAGVGGDPGTGGAAGAGGDAAGGAAGAGGDAAGGAAGAGGDAAGGAAGAGGEPAGGAAGAGGDPAGGAAGAGGAPCTEPNGKSNPVNGHCYFTLPGGPRTWTSARDACAMLAGAHLVTITSQAEQDFVAGMNLNQTSWIGLSGPLASLAWVGGETSNFTAWAPNQPNGSGNVCVRIDSQTKLWNDDQCNKSNGALCERD